ncbi:MAG: hypothetical protein V7K25_05515 [Nostoc sp.]|uniref:hypothetical protein n=1 Tax=Nostoc sp. TaxID=1180 RepID=UPI002FF89F40
MPLGAATAAFSRVSAALQLTKVVERVNTPATHKIRKLRFLDIANMMYYQFSGV